MTDEKRLCSSEKRIFASETHHMWHIFGRYFYFPLSWLILLFRVFILSCFSLYFSSARSPPSTLHQFKILYSTWPQSEGFWSRYKDSDGEKQDISGGILGTTAHFSQHPSWSLHTWLPQIWFSHLPITVPCLSLGSVHLSLDMSCFNN